MFKINDSVIISGGNNAYVICVDDNDSTKFEGMNGDKCQFSAEEGGFLKISDGNKRGLVYVGGTSLTKDEIANAKCISVIALGDKPDDFDTILILTNNVA